MKEIAISFFAGAGGLDMGIHQAGFDVRLSVELEEKYCKTLRVNNPDMNVVCGDIMNYSKEKIYREAGLDNEEISLMFGGSPCQSFSTAGKRRAFEDERGLAMIKFAELIEEIKPKAFLIENVTGLLSAPLKNRPHKERGEGYPPLSEEEGKGSALKFLLRKFKSYNITYQKINAADYGVPQKRERVFIIGFRKDLDKIFEFPKPTHGQGIKRYSTFRDVLKEVVNVKHEHSEYTEKRLKYMKLIPVGGGNWKDLDEDVAKEAMGKSYYSGGGKTGFFRRIKIDEPAPTMLTSPTQNSTVLGHPLEDRPLSIQEYLVIQGFPVNYNVNGSLADKYIQIGNAVPVPIAKIIGEKIIETLKK